MGIVCPLLSGIFNITAWAGRRLCPEVLIDIGKAGALDSLPGWRSWAEWFLSLVATPKQPILLAEEGGPRDTMVAWRSRSPGTGPA